MPCDLTTEERMRYNGLFFIMNLVMRFRGHADGVALVEMSLPHDERLLGGDPLPDWRDALIRAAGEQNIKVGIRDMERGYMAAFETQDECERAMAAMDPIWQDWLMTHLKLAAWRLYRENPQSGRQAVDELARDYGFTYEHFASFIDEKRSERNRSMMTDEYNARLGERMREAQAEGTIRFQDCDHDRDDGQDLAL